MLWSTIWLSFVRLHSVRGLMDRAIPADKRPFDYSPVSLSDLPETPTRDRNIAAVDWDASPY